MANNKVQLGDGTVLMDLTSDTVTPSALRRGATAHDASGAQITGTMDGGGTDNLVIYISATSDLEITNIQTFDFDEVYSRLNNGTAETIYAIVSIPNGMFVLRCTSSRMDAQGATTVFRGAEHYSGDKYKLWTGVYSLQEDVPEDAYAVETTLSGNTVYVAFRLTKEANVRFTLYSNADPVYAGDFNVADGVAAMAAGDPSRFSLLEYEGNGLILDYKCIGGIGTALVFVVNSVPISYTITVTATYSQPEADDSTVCIQELEYDGNTIYIEYRKNRSLFHNVSFSGSYNDLSDKPTIPTVPEISTNIALDAGSNVKTVSPKAVKTWVEGKGYLTQHQSLSGYVMASELDDVAFSGDYGDLNNTPTIPTVPAISTNITTDAASDVKTTSPKAVKTFVEDKGYQTASQVNTLIDNATIDADTVDGYHIVVSSSAPAAGTANNIITIVR